MDTSFLQAVFQIVLGGAIVLGVGILIGASLMIGAMRHSRRRARS
jgi:Ca2+/H+ antiporter